MVALPDEPGSVRFLKTTARTLLWALGVAIAGFILASGVMGLIRAGLWLRAELFGSTLGMAGIGGVPGSTVMRSVLVRWIEPRTALAGFAPKTAERSGPRGLVGSWGAVVLGSGRAGD